METVDKKIHTSARFPHGRSIKWPRVYRALRRQGKSKSAAAAISNAHWNKYRRWGRAGMPGPKSMAERQRQQRLRKVLMGDVHANAPLDDHTEWNDDHLSDVDIEAIAEDAAEIWEVQDDGTVIEKAVKGTKINGGGGQQPYDERGRYAGKDAADAAKPAKGKIRPGAEHKAAAEAGYEAVFNEKMRYHDYFMTAPNGIRWQDEYIKFGRGKSTMSPQHIVEGIGKANKALWEASSQTKIRVLTNFDDVQGVDKGWSAAHSGTSKTISINGKAFDKIARDYPDPEDQSNAVAYVLNHEMSHAIDSVAPRLGGYLSNTKYKEMVDRWEEALANGSMHVRALPPKFVHQEAEDTQSMWGEWAYATSYHRDPLTMRVELFAEAMSFAITPHKRAVLKTTDEIFKRRGIDVSIERDVQQILRDLGLEDQMHKSRTGKYGATMSDIGGDGHIFADDPDDITIMEVRKRRLRLKLGGVSILKRTVGTKRNGSGAQQEYDEFGRWTSGGRISTVPPKGKVKGADKPHPMHDIRKMSVDQAMKEDPEIAAKWMEKLGQVAGFEDLKPDASDDAKKVRGYVHKAIQRIKQNILDIHDRADPADAKRWGEWYPIANKLGTKWSKETGVHPDAVYAVMARLSPQADWNDNMTMAREVVRLLHEDPVVTKDVLKAHRALQLKQAEMYGKEPDAPLPQDMAGKRLSELSDLDAGKMVRAISDTRGPLQVIDHEENPMVKEDGEPRYVRWQSNDNLMRSVSIFRNPTFENISQQMGEQHKIRAFYNNIRDPHDEEFDDVTVDTHAYGIGLGIPVTTASTEITNAKGSITLPGAPKSTKAGTVGVYPIFVEAYREAAKERGMIGRRMQSITWEQWRKEWSPKARAPWMVDTARNIQHAAARGDIDREESWKILAEFRRQLPGAEGGGTNKEENITGDAARYVPSRYDGKIDKARDVQRGAQQGILIEDLEEQP